MQISLDFKISKNIFPTSEYEYDDKLKAFSKNFKRTL